MEISNSDKLSPWTNKEKLTIEDEDLVLGWIVQKGCSWTTEMANTYEFSMEDAKHLIRKLIKKGFLKQLFPDPMYPQPLIACRIMELNYKGIDSYGKFTERNWYIASAEGLAYYLDKVFGKGKKMQKNYMNEYPWLFEKLEMLQ